MNSKALLFVMVSMMIASVYTESPAAPDDVPEAIQCYVCNSAEDSSCADEYSPKQAHKQECTNGETFCRKTIQYVRDETTVIRQCAKELYKPDYEGCYKTAGKSTQKVCTCKAVNGMPCNTAVVAKSSFGALCLSVVIAKMFL